MFKVEDKNGSQFLINPLHISYIREVNKKTIEISLVGLDESVQFSTIRVSTEGRDPRMVLEDWEIQLDRWYATNLRDRR